MKHSWYNKKIGETSTDEEVTTTYVRTCRECEVEQTSENVDAECPQKEGPC